MSLFDFLQHLFIDHIHALAQMIWVIANLCWAVEDLFYSEANDVPYPLDSQ